MLSDLLRLRRREEGPKIATLCMIIACLDDEGEGIRKKGPDRDWLRRREERRSYAGFVTELAAEDLPSFLLNEQHWNLVNIVFMVDKLRNIMSPSPGASIQTDYIVESTFSRIFVFLELTLQQETHIHINLRA